MRTTNYNKILEKDYQKLLDKYDEKSEEYKQLKYEYQLLNNKLKIKNKQLDNFEESAKAKYQPLLDEKEKALINRILEYKSNYFIWMQDFSLPCDDNLSERALRGAKSKMKIAGQFQNVQTANFYADIKTYIETCYRNNINPTDALIRLMEDNPYMVSEKYNEKIVIKSLIFIVLFYFRLWIVKTIFFLFTKLIKTSWKKTKIIVLLY